MVTLVVLAAYFSLLLELTLFRVPSKVGFFENFKRQKSKRKGLFRTILILLGFATFLYPAFYLVFFKTDNPYSDSVYNLILAIFLIVFGRLLSLVAVFRIRKKNTQKENHFYLHTDGIYKISRNPIQVGLYLFLIGLWLLFSSYVFLVGILIYIIYMHFMIKLEEDFLRNRFGETYKFYCSCTKRYL